MSALLIPNLVVNRGMADIIQLSLLFRVGVNSAPHFKGRSYIEALRTRRKGKKCIYEVKEITES
jgi:hypothetical protein